MKVFAKRLMRLQFEIMLKEMWQKIITQRKELNELTQRYFPVHKLCVLIFSVPAGKGWVKTILSSSKKIILIRFFYLDIIISF